MVRYAGTGCYVVAGGVEEGFFNFQMVSGKGFDYFL